MKYKIKRAKNFKKQIKKIPLPDKEKVLDVVNRLANNETLEPKYKDHKLSGEYKDFRECHIKPDLLLIYQKQDSTLVLVCVAVGKHSELF